ncbi:MAG: glycosyltransferase [Candidatus Omnitrophica bacterium]|nr:glycosyltransferase [Candidatus Omnitrophota bacterium]
MNTVSVIIPSYNCGQYITEGIESVLQQTYRDREIVIVDDGSTDETKKILESYINSKQIRYFYQENKGPAAARNTGIREAKGAFLAFLDADDLWEKGKLEKSIDFMEKNNFDWLCTSLKKIDENGREIIKRIPEDSWVLVSSTGEMKQLRNGLFFFSSIPVHTPTIVAKKICFEKVGIFDERFLIGEDTDLWLRFEEAGLKGGYLDEPLTIYRYNENSITKARKVDGLNEHAKVAKKHALILGLEKTSIRKSYTGFLWQIADRYYSHRSYFNALRYIMRSFCYDPKTVFEKIKRILKT